MATRMLQRRGTEAQWANANPVLGAGEIGFETDTGQFKIGDGTSNWDDLSYFKNLEDLGGSLDDYILLTEKGSANGVATLDGSNLIPDAQISNNIARSSDVTNLVSNAIADITNNAPLILDTLAELANALNNDGEFFLTISNSINTSLDAANDYTDNNINILSNNISDQLDLAEELTANNLANAVSSLQGEIANAITTSEAYTDNVAAFTLGNAQSYTDGVEDSLSQSIANAITDLEAYADDAVSNHNLETDSVHGIANTLALATITYVDGEIQTHLDDTANVHGISNTLALSTTTYVDEKSANVFSNAVSNAASQIEDHNLDTSNVHGIADTTKIVLTDANTQTLTGSLTINGNLVVDNDITVNGNSFAASATSITIEDNMVQLAHENPANTVDLGLVVAYNNGSNLHAGIVRDVSADRWKFFEGYGTEPTTTVDFGQALLDDLELNDLFVADITVTGNTVVSASGVTFTDGSQTKEGVPSRTPIIQKTASYTLSALTERDSLIEMSNASATTVTIPLNSAVAFPIGTSLDILQTGAGQVTIAGASGVTVNATPGLKLRAQWSSATLFKRAENTWVVYGDLSA